MESTDQENLEEPGHTAPEPIGELIPVQDAPSEPSVVAEEPKKSNSLALTIFLAILGIGIIAGVALIVILLNQLSDRHRELAKLRLQQQAVALIPDTITEKIFDGDEDFINRAITARIDLAQRDSRGFTPLMAAIISQNDQLAELLIDAGVPVNTLQSLEDRQLPHESALSFPQLIREHCMRSSATPLHLAALVRNTSMMRALIKNGADVNARTNSGWTPITCAAFVGDSDTVAALLQNGADPELASRTSFTPLMASMYGDNPEVVRLLLERAGNIGAQDQSGDNALHHLAMRKNTNAQIPVQLLAKEPLDKVKDKLGNSPLMTAAGSGNLSLVISLLRGKENLKDKNETGEAAWQIAERMGHSDLVPLLHPEYRLYSAIMSRSPHLISLALTHGADVNASDRDGISPLIFSLTDSRPHLHRKLLHIDSSRRYLAAGAKTVMVSNRTLSRQVRGILAISELLERNRLNDLGSSKSALQLGEEDSLTHQLLIPGNLGLDTPVALSQISNSAPPRDLFLSNLRSSELDITQQLLSMGADPNATDHEGNSPLLYAVQAGDMKRVALLLSQGADYMKANEDGLFPLLHAVRLRRADMAEAMLVAKPLPAPSGELEEVLLAATDNNFTGVVQLLLQKGVYPDPEDVAGRRLLVLTLARGDYDTAEMLVKAGATLSFRDHSLQTLYMYAHTEERVRLRQFFEKHGKDWNEIEPLLLAAKHKKNPRLIHQTVEPPKQSR